MVDTTELLDELTELLHEKNPAGFAGGLGSLLGSIATTNDKACLRALSSLSVFRKLNPDFEPAAVTLAIEMMLAAALSLRTRVVVEESAVVAFEDCICQTYSFCS